MKTVKRILLVDDDEITNFINHNLIARLGFAQNIVVKTNGQDALNYLSKECRKEEKYPDLILLDLKMPGMDGFDFLKAFERLCSEFKYNIVVVILTTSRAPDDIIQLRNMGNYFIVDKPLTTEKLIDIHHRYFRNPGMEQQMA